MLETTWFMLWGLLWAIYFMLDGFDLGMGTLLPFITRDETERRVIYNSAGPFWDGNEVWLITAGGVTFAAFPKAYAVMFSALYAPLLILLFALIIRGVSFEFRNKVHNDQWKKVWDAAHFLGSFLPTILLGVAFANLFMGIPIDGEGVYHGNILKLLNIYGLLGGVLFLLLFLVHGALWLSFKSQGDIHDRAVTLAGKLWLYLLVFAVVFLVASGYYTDLYENYIENPALFIVPLLAVAGLICTRLFIAIRNVLFAWIANCVTIVACTFFGVIGMFPALIPSNMNPLYSITVMNGSSSPLTLTIMLWVVICCLPIVIGYQFWVYRTFSHKIETEEDLHY